MSTRFWPCSLYRYPVWTRLHDVQVKDSAMHTDTQTGRRTAISPDIICVTWIWTRRAWGRTCNGVCASCNDVILCHSTKAWLIRLTPLRSSSIQLAASNQDMVGRISFLMMSPCVWAMHRRRNQSGRKLWILNEVLVLSMTRLAINFKEDMRIRIQATISQQMQQHDKSIYKFIHDYVLCTYW